MRRQIPRHVRLGSSTPTPAAKAAPPLPHRLRAQPVTSAAGGGSTSTGGGTRLQPPPLAVRRRPGAAAAQQARPLSTYQQKAWIPNTEQDMIEMTRQAMVFQLTVTHASVAEGLVNWFTTNMPASYFRQVDKDTQMSHLRSLAAQWDHEGGKFMRAGGGEAFRGSNRIVLQSANQDGNLEVAYMDFSGNQKVRRSIDQVCVRETGAGCPGSLTDGRKGCQ